MKHLISLKEQSREDILDILELARKLKELRAKGKVTDYLKNKTLIMLFQKTSTRTRLSFEAAMTELGGHAIFLDQRTSQLGLADFDDEIRAIMRFGQVLMFRALRVADVLRASSYNQIPVIDACSEKYHPAQSLGDMFTMLEYSSPSSLRAAAKQSNSTDLIKDLKNIKKVVWLGIENNVSNTLKLACVKLGISFVIVAPEVDKASVDEKLNKMADDTGLITRTLDLKEALAGADYVHTDTWLNMEFFEPAGSTMSEVERVGGSRVKPEFAEEFERRKKLFMPYQLNAKLIDTYAPKAKIMHCLPAHIGYEISRDAMDHKNSIVFDQAENRLHIEKAIIMWLLNKNP